MITVDNLVKKFDDFTALNNLTCRIPEGCIYGLVGANGAGKSTFLRLITGIYKPTSGDIAIDGLAVYDKPETKALFSFVPDDLFLMSGASMNRMAALYRAYYPSFSNERYKELTELFGLDPRRSTGTFSKGMKRQAATILSLSCMSKYIFFDETFDGLDPVMRNLVKKIIYNDVCERGATAVITSHSLRELEDTCDQLALLYQGGIIFESEIDNLNTKMFKVQVAYSDDYDRSRFEGIEMMQFSKKGSVSTFIARGDKEEVMAKLKAHGPILLDSLPLSLEEVFVYEMEALGYAFQLQ